MDLGNFLDSVWCQAVGVIVRTPYVVGPDIAGGALFTDETRLSLRNALPVVSLDSNLLYSQDFILK